MKVNKLEQKIPGVSALIYINQCHTYQQRFEKKLRLLIKKNIPDVSGLVAATVLDTKVREFERKSSW